ncbi:MAG: M20/M25/M40 family metallo-hydrolase [Firmicutes bacterium]|nr:M20/M25/M40 family metallo-hydrolase [Bacillota bacterium]
MKEFYDFFQNEELYPDLDVEGAVQRLSRAVQFKTVSDNPDAQPFFDLHEHIKASFPHIMQAGTFEAVGRSVLITVKGTDEGLKPALFMSHIDVVPVVAGTEADWTHDAYSGHVDGTFIWGRGTQDIKVQVFGELEALEYLLAHGEKPQRTVYLAFGQDEETFNTGAQAISDLLKSRGITLEFLVDEGGGGISKGSIFGAPETDISNVCLMEKGYADLKLTVESKGGHSSRPFGGTSLERLARAITKICDDPFPPQLSGTLKATFRALQPYVTEEPLKTLLQDIDGNEEKLADYCLHDEHLFPLVITTIAPTMIEGSSAAPNVMPQNMSAVINFRLAAGYDPEKLMAHCRKAVDDDSVKMEFLQANASSAEARSDGYGYAKLVESMSHFYTGLVFVPAITVGGTDAHCYEQICDTCLRCGPMMSPEDESAAHGTDEKIRIRAFAQGIRTLIHLMENTCIHP